DLCRENSGAISDRLVRRRSSTMARMIPGSWPQRTRDVPRIDPIPFDEFNRRFILPEQPVIVRGAVSASSEGIANPDVLCDMYASVGVRVLLDIPDNFLTDMAHENVREMTLREFAAHLRSPARTRPCYANQLSMDTFPALKEATALDAVKPGMRPAFVWLG